jgi:hypothetical protein
MAADCAWEPCTCFHSSTADGLASFDGRFGELLRISRKSCGGVLLQWRPVCILFFQPPGRTSKWSSGRATTATTVHSRVYSVQWWPWKNLFGDNQGDKQVETKEKLFSSSTYYFQFSPCDRLIFLYTALPAAHQILVCQRMLGFEPSAVTEFALKVKAVIITWLHLIFYLQYCTP